MTEAEVDEVLQSLLEDGSVQSITDSVVKFDWPKFKILHPEFAKEMWLLHLNEVDQALFGLADKGYLTLEVQETDEGFGLFVTGITEKGQEYLG